MKRGDRELLAREAAKVLVAAACAGMREFWDRYEQLHDRASTQDGARRAAEPLLSVCAACPIITACRTWARLDRYTGIAGGGAWIKGKPRPAHFIRPKGSFRRRLAS